MPHQYLPETLALIEQAERDIAAEKAAATDTTAVDNMQLAGLIAVLERAQQVAAEQGVTVLDIYGQRDPQWAGPSLPHPTEATSEAEQDELREGWGDWQQGIEANQPEQGDEAGL